MREVPEEIIESQKTIVEGHRATDCLHQFCLSKGIEAPIMNQIFEVSMGRDPKVAIHALMTRELKAE